MAFQKDAQRYTGFAVRQGKISSHLSKLTQLLFRDGWEKYPEQERKISPYPERLINKKAGTAGLAGFSEYFCHSVESFPGLQHVILFVCLLPTSRL